MKESERETEREGKREREKGKERIGERIIIERGRYKIGRLGESERKSQTKEERDR